MRRAVSRDLEVGGGMDLKELHGTNRVAQGELRGLIKKYPNQKNHSSDNVRTVPSIQLQLRKQRLQLHPGLLKFGFQLGEHAFPVSFLKVKVLVAKDGKSSLEHHFLLSPTSHNIHQGVKVVTRILVWRSGTALIGKPLTVLK